MGAVAGLAGGTPLEALRLAVSMTALQVAIGVLNDLIDAPLDAGRKLGKPIPAGVIPARIAWATVVVSAGTGVLLASISGPLLAVLALAVLAIGFSYDLVARGTIWSWVPFAVGVPILPVFGWLGVAGSLPSWFAPLVPAAGLAGAALAIANARADVERDRAAGTESVATRLGSARAWRLNAALLVMVLAISITWLVLTGTAPLRIVPVGVAAGVVLSGVVLGRHGSPGRRERAWEVEAGGVAALGIAWVYAVTA